MILHPDLRALRGDDTPQRQAQDRLFAAMAQWRSRTEVMDVMADLADFASGQPLKDCPALARLFEPQGTAAHDLAGGFIQTHIAALREAPLGQPALRHFTDGAISTLLLGRAGNVTLTLVALDGAALSAQPKPLSASFAPVENWERVLAGSAFAELLSRRPAGSRDDGLERQALTLTPGSVVCRAPSRQAMLVKRVQGALLSLRLQRRDADAGPAVEIELASGRQLHQAAGNPRDSRVEMMLALLGRMDRSDAAPAMAEIALSHRSGALRWQALRECLALDTATGFAALCAMAERTNDPLQPPATALRGQLLAAHPQLQEIAPCPAY